jgi:hypothetical protein
MSKNWEMSKTFVKYFKWLFSKFNSLTEHQDPDSDRATQFNSDPSGHPDPHEPGHVFELFYWYDQNIYVLRLISERKDRICGLPSGYYIPVTIYDAFLLVDFRSGQVRDVCPQSLFALFSVLSVFYDKEIPCWLIAGEDMAEGKSLTAIKHTPPR